MSENNFNSDLDAILAEFASYSSSLGGEPEAKKAPAPKQDRQQYSVPPVEQAPVWGEEEEPAEPEDGYYVDVVRQSTEGADLVHAPASVD